MIWKSRVVSSGVALATVGHAQFTDQSDYTNILPLRVSSMDVQDSCSRLIPCLNSQFPTQESMPTPPSIYPGLIIDADRRAMPGDKNCPNGGCFLLDPTNLCDAYGPSCVPIPNIVLPTLPCDERNPDCPTNGITLNLDFSCHPLDHRCPPGGVFVNPKPFLAAPDFPSAQWLPAWLEPCEGGVSVCPDGFEVTQPITPAEIADEKIPGFLFYAEQFCHPSTPGCTGDQLVVPTSPECDARFPGCVPKDRIRYPLDFTSDPKCNSSECIGITPRGCRPNTYGSPGCIEISPIPCPISPGCTSGFLIPDPLAPCTLGAPGCTEGLPRPLPPLADDQAEVNSTGEIVIDWTHDELLWQNGKETSNGPEFRLSWKLFKTDFEEPMVFELNERLRASCKYALFIDDVEVAQTRQASETYSNEIVCGNADPEGCIEAGTGYLRYVVPKGDHIVKVRRVEGTERADYGHHFTSSLFSYRLSKLPPKSSPTQVTPPVQEIPTPTPSSIFPCSTSDNAPCLGKQIKPWATHDMKWDNGDYKKPNMPIPFTLPILNFEKDTVLEVVDVWYQNAHYTLRVDGKDVAESDEGRKFRNEAISCGQADDCIKKGFGHAFALIPAGRHEVEVVMSDGKCFADNGFSYWFNRVLWRLVEACDAENCP